MLQKMRVSKIMNLEQEGLPLKKDNREMKFGWVADKLNYQSLNVTPALIPKLRGKVSTTLFFVIGDRAKRNTG